MPSEVERKLSEQDKQLAQELGRNLGGTARDLPNTMPGAPTHTPTTKADGNGQAERYRGLGQDGERRSPGSLGSRMSEQRERQAGGPEQGKAQEQGRER